MGDELRGENLVHLNVRFSTETELKKIQDFLYEKSGQGVSFTGLVEAMANEVTIVTAVHNIKSNKGSRTAGVDKIKMDKYLQMPKDELILLIQSSFRNYRPKPARREYIEKSNGTILFTAFLLGWLEMTKKNVEETTYGAYSMGIKSKIIPYFEEHHPGLALQDVTPKHIQDYYTYELTVRGVSANTVIHRHANIRKALQHAFKLGLIDSNPADRIERPKKEKFVGSFYEEDELNHLFEVVRGDPIELGVILGAFYGLRRSEAVGLKWDAIDFKKKTITIRHTVTQATIDGKSKIIQKDRTKTKASYRSLPLVPPFEELLHRLKAEQELNRKLCGKSYCRKFADYIYVNEIGELVKPGYITQHFPLILQKNGMRKIRFHDLRHPYVKHTTKNKSLQKQKSQAINRF